MLDRKMLEDQAKRANPLLGRIRNSAIIVTSFLIILVGIGFLGYRATHVATHVGKGVASTNPTAPAATPRPFHWATIASPHPGAGDDQLAGTAVVDANDAWVVGFYHPQRNSPFDHTLTERWNGRAWSVVASPNPGTGGNFLSGVAAVDASNAWAVGEYQNGAAGADQTLIEHWNGQAWSVVASPNPGAGTKFLFSVAMIDAQHAWAAGFYEDATSGILHSLIEAWNGQAWSLVPSPNQGVGNNELYGISAVSAGDIWAVGDVQDDHTGLAHTLIEHWNGSAWSVVPSPNPGMGNNVLAGITARDAQDAWAVGYAQLSNSGPSQTVIERWNGSAWSVESTPNPGAGDNQLYSITMIDAENALAVGNYQDGNGKLQTLTERWDGRAWSVETTPNPGTDDNSLDGVAAVDVQHVWAVGVYHNGSPAHMLILQGHIG